MGLFSLAVQCKLGESNEVHCRNLKGTANQTIMMMRKNNVIMKTTIGSHVSFATHIHVYSIPTHCVQFIGFLHFFSLFCCGLELTQNCIAIAGVGACECDNRPRHSLVYIPLSVPSLCCMID